MPRRLRLVWNENNRLSRQGQTQTRVSRELIPERGEPWNEKEMAKRASCSPQIGSFGITVSERILFPLVDHEVKWIQSKIE